MATSVYGRQYGAMRNLVAGSTQSDMSAPTAESEFVIANGYNAIEWHVKLGTGCTSYTVTLYRWVKPEPGRTGNSYAVVDATYVGETASRVFTQERGGCPVFLRIHSIAGTLSADFSVDFRGVNL